MVRVVTAGHVNWDVVLRVESLPDPDGEARISSQHRSGGGSAANVGVGLGNYGADVSVIGSVGDDEPGFLARRELDREGVDISHLRTIRSTDTTVKYMIVDASGEVMVLGNDGANERFEPGGADETAVRGANHLHLTSQRPATAKQLAAVASDAGVSVSFDPGRLLAERDYGDLPDVVDVLFLNRREAELALPESDSSEAVAGTDRVLVVKRGADGASVYTSEGEIHHAGFAVDPVDTTGAGDAFAAGFLAVLTGVWDDDPDTAPDFSRALEVGNACGALSTLEEGARTAPTRATATDFITKRADHD